MVDNIGNEGQNLPTDEENWIAFFELAFRSDSSGASSFAHLLFTLKEAIESGPAGARWAASALLDGIRLAYLYTNEHKLALRLYLLYLTGHLTPPNEPINLLRSAIDNGTAEVERACRKGSAIKSKSRTKGSIGNKRDDLS